MWRDERAAAGAAWPGLPPAIAQSCLEAFASEAPSDTSHFQASVRETLEVLLEAPLEEEVRTPQGYLLDLVATIRGVKVSFEVDGPSHFFDGREPTGYTIVKRRLLRSHGYALVSIPYWDWDAKGVTRRAEVLTQKLVELEGELQASKKGDR